MYILLLWGEFDMILMYAILVVCIIYTWIEYIRYKKLDKRCSLKITGKIESYTLEKEDTNGRQYRVKVRYIVNGKEYNRETIIYSGKDFNIIGLSEIAMRVNPDNPEEYVDDHSGKTNILWITVRVTIILASVGIGVAILCGGNL